MIGSVDDETISAMYARTLKAYLKDRSEEALYSASLLSEHIVQSGLGPEDIVALHFEVLPALLDEVPPRARVIAVSDAHQFLLEVMIAYGARYREYLELKLVESVRTAEEAAARVQEEAQQAGEREEQMRQALMIITHELRNPLTAARGSVDLALRSLVGKNVDRLPLLLDSAKEALDRLSNLTGQLAEVSHNEGLTLHQVRVNVNPLVQQAVGWAMPSAGSKGLTLVFNTPPIGVAVHADPDALLSVFGNLVANAVRYTPKGGRIEVTTFSDGDCAVVSVRDSGVGISPDDLQHIFERFYRSDQARKLVAEGMGLGLALAKQLVEAHGGSIAVESSVGVGSTFTVWLPLAGEEKDGDCDDDER